MLEAPQGAKLVSFHGVVKRADGRVEDLGLIDHSHAWLFSENELRAMCHAAEHLDNLLNLRRLKEPGAVIIPAGSGLIEAGKGEFAGQIGGQTSTPPQYIGFGQGGVSGTLGTRPTAATTDLCLHGEIVANGAQTQRIAGSVSQVTTTNDLDTMQVVGTITCNLGGGLSIVEAGLFTTQPWPAQTTVNGAYTSGGTSLTVAGHTGFPGSGNYYIQIGTPASGAEVMLVTAGQGTNAWTVSGAQNGSAAANHSIGDFVTCYGTAVGGGTGASGLPACIGDFALISLAQNDSLQLTAKVQLT